MNTKGIKFLAVLAVLAMAFAAFAVITDADDNDAADVTPTIGLDKSGVWTDGIDQKQAISNSFLQNSLSIKEDTSAATDVKKVYKLSGYANYAKYNDPNTKLGEVWGNNCNGWGENIVGIIGFSIENYKDAGYTYVYFTGISGVATDVYEIADIQEKGGYIYMANWFTDDNITAGKLSGGGAITFHVYLGGEDMTNVGANVAYTIDIKYSVEVACLSDNVNALYKLGTAGFATKVVDSKGNGWIYKDGETKKTLTLNNYDGKQYFSGEFTDVILAGTNKIAVADAPFAIKSTGNLSIANDSGIASLTIAMTESDVYGATLEDKKVYGISANALTVSGVDLNITISGKGLNAIGIKSGLYTIFNSTQNISVLPGAYGDYAVSTSENYAVGAYGIVSNGMDVKASELNVIAGFAGILAGLGMTVSASAVTSTASAMALDTGALAVSQTSDLELAVLGLTANVQAYALSADTIENKSYSSITANGIALYDGESDNYAMIANTGDMIIGAGAKFVNQTDGVFINTGTIGCYGKIEVAKGTFSNTGTINMFNSINAVPEGGIVFNDATEGVSKNKNYVKKIVIEDYVQPLADGTALVKANVTFDKSTTYEADPVFGNFFGIVKYDAAGKLVSLTLTATTYDLEFTKYTAKVTVTSSKLVSTNVVYNVVSSGKYYTVAPNDITGSYKSAATGEAAQTAFTMAAAAADEFVVAGGEFTNDGALNIYAIKVTEGKATLISSGKFINNGTVNITTANADLEIKFAGGTTTNNGIITSDTSIATSGTTGSFKGPIVVSEGVQVKVGATIDSEITYVGEYVVDPEAATPVKAPFSNTIALKGKGTGFVVTAVAPEDGKAGVLALSDLDKVDAEKATEITLTDGKAVNNSAIIGAKLVLGLADGTVLDIVANTAVNGVIAVQDGATLNYSIEELPETYVYGDLVYTISFAKGGYTYYGNLAFALANAEEGMTLNLASEETIDSDTVVKKGIQLVFAKEAVLNIVNVDKKITVSMEDGAAFVLGDDAVININNAKVSGTIIYGDNEFVMKNPTFSNNAAFVATITAVPVDGDDVAAIAINTHYNDGAIELVEGMFTGEMKLDAVMNGEKVKTYALLTIDEDALSAIEFDAVDALADKAKIELSGAILVMENVVLSTPITGTGKVLVDDGCTVTLAGDVAQTFTILSGFNGFKLDAVMWLTEYDELEIDDDFAIRFTAVPETASDDAYLDIFGWVFDGDISTIGNTATDGLILTEDAGYETPLLAVLAVEADTVFTVIDNGEEFTVNATGVLKVAGTINMYTEDTTDYGAVNYDVIYTDGAYTVYAKLASAAQQAPAGTNFEVTEELVINTPLTLNNGNTITITGKDAVLVIHDTVLTVGNPATSLGAVDAIVGKVLLEAGAYAVIYSGADVSGAQFVYGADEKTAKTSNYSIDNITYCDVYATEGVEVAGVNAEIGVPKITGLKFQGWVQYVAAAENIGETDVYARTLAVQYKITLTSVTGVQYKVAGSSSVVLDSPFYVDYGTVVNAVPASGYAGATQTWTVDKDMTITAQAYQPVQPEPTPEPSVDGISLTDILLIVLVIMIAVMVVVVLLRMNRS